MFLAAETFNQPLDRWDVSRLKTAGFMFCSAVAFNQPLGNWDVSGVTYAPFMFQGAEAFDQSLEAWDVSSIPDRDRVTMFQELARPPTTRWLPYDHPHTVWLRHRRSWRQGRIFREETGTAGTARAS